MLLLSIVIGDLRYLDQQITVFGIDPNVLIQIFFGLGFLPIFFAKERHVSLLLRVAVLAQAVLFVIQFLVGPGIPRLSIFCAFHFSNGVSTACGFYLFAFALNNVERLFTMAAAQVYFAFSYLFLHDATFFLDIGSVVVMLALVVATFAVCRQGKPSNDTQGAQPRFAFAIRQIPRPGSAPVTESKELGAWESGIAAVIVLSMVYNVITLMTLYIEYNEATVSAALYGIGGIVSLLVIFVIMLVFNYSALHLWSLCLVCSVLGIGALYYTSAFAVGAGSLLYGIGNGLGFMILYYLQGGALKRSGSFKLLRLFCLFAFFNYAVVYGLFNVLYSNLNAPNLSLAFPVVLVLALICFLIAPVLHDKLFRTDWTDGYHMADMPLYAEAFKQIEQADKVNGLGLTPREKEIFTLLMTEASFKEIASTLHLSGSTVNFHTKNLYRKLNIQGRTELLVLYSNRTAAPV